MAQLLAADLLVIKDGWLENGSCIGDFPIQTFMYKGFSSHVWSPEGISMNIPVFSILKHPWNILDHYYQRVYPIKSHEKPPFSHGFPMVFPWFSHGFPMVSPKKTWIPLIPTNLRIFARLIARGYRRVVFGDHGPWAPQVVGDQSMINSMGDPTGNYIWSIYG